MSFFYDIIYGMEKFRVISDLHMDINYNYPFRIKDNDTFTVIAGDTTGERAMISYTKSNKNISVDIHDVRKFIKYFNCKKSVKIDFDGEKWFYGKKELNYEDSGLKISIIDSDKPLKSQESVTFAATYPHDWIKKNIKNGIMVAGNHIVYNRDGKSIEELKEELHQEYPIDSNLTFLDNSVGVMCKEVDGILFIGSTLYTDYKLKVVDIYDSHTDKNISDEQMIIRNMSLASPKMSGGGLNDFVYGKTFECTYNKAFRLEADDDMSWLTPKNYQMFFDRTFNEIKRIVEENSDKTIVIVTHHCPSPKCISKRYVSDMLNASYVSDLEKFIVEHENIKCWVCGHVHHRNHFKVGNCLVVMNPLGYCKHGQFKETDESEQEWTPYLYVNTKTWEVEREEFNNSKWKTEYNKYQKKLIKMYGGFSCFF